MFRSREASLRDQIEDAIEEAETLRELFMVLESAVVRVEDDRQSRGNT